MRTKENIKSVLICVLLIGAFYLTYSVWFFDSPVGSFSLRNLFGGVQSDSADLSSGMPDIEKFGVRPMSIVINKDGKTFAEIYQSVESDKLYAQLREPFSKILSDIKRSYTITEKQWEELIRKDGVLCDYRGELPLSTLGLWLDSAAAEVFSESGRYILFSAAEKHVAVYVKNSRTETISRFSSGVSSESLMTALASLSAKAATLACDSPIEDFHTVSPEFPIVETRANPAQLNAYNPLVTFSQDMTSSVLACFKMNKSTLNTYSEQDGTQVYIADVVTLKITSGGVVTYMDPRESIDELLGLGVEYENGEPTPAEALEASRALAASIAAARPGTGGIYLIEFTQTDTGTVALFGWHVGGIPVDMLNTAYFARIETTGSRVSAATFNMRSFDASAVRTETLTERLAAAAMAGNGQSGDLNLRYADTGVGTIAASWYVGGVKKQGERSR